MTSPLRIPDQHDDEEVLYVLHRYGLTFSGRVLFFLLLFLVPLIFAFLLRNAVGDILQDRGTAAILLVLGASLYYVFIGLRLFHAWLVYALDAWVVTSKRVADIAQRGTFSRVVSEIPLDRIEDVQVEIHGFVPTLLQYGNIHIQTANDHSRLLFQDVLRPNLVARRIMELRDCVVGTPNSRHDIPPPVPPPAETPV